MRCMRDLRLSGCTGIHKSKLLGTVLELQKEAFNVPGPSSGQGRPGNMHVYGLGPFLFF